MQLWMREGYGKGKEGEERGGEAQRMKAQGRAAQTGNKSRRGGEGWKEGGTGDAQKGQRGNDRSRKEMNGSVRIKGNTESDNKEGEQSRWRR